MKANQSSLTRVLFTVLLQAMKDEPPADYKCKDKFLIQSAVIVSEFEDASLPELVSPAFPDWFDGWSNDAQRL